MDEKTKTCTKCHETKALEEFSARSDRPSGKVSRCKLCVSVATKARYKPRVRKRADYSAGKKCAGCGDLKPLEAFSPGASRCKVCTAAARRAQRASNPAKEREIQREWREANRDRLRALNKARRDADPEKYRAQKRARYWADPEKARERARQWAQANPEKTRARMAAWVKANPEKRKAQARKRNTGFTATLFEASLLTQGACCAICRRDLTEVTGRHRHADHDHAANLPRGVLCNSCNVGLGMFKDDPAILRRAIAYLERPPIHPFMATLCNGITEAQAREIVLKSGCVQIP